MSTAPRTSIRSERRWKSRASSRFRTSSTSTGRAFYLDYRGYSHMRLAIEDAPWGAGMMEVIDPFGSWLRFREPR